MTETKDETKLVTKLQRVLKRTGSEVVEKALWLWYAAQNPKTPKWAKTTIWSALVYLLVPIDAIPDVLPALGYSDDLGVIAAAIIAVAAYIDDDVKAKAREKLNSFGLGTAAR